jgi:16S rRNA G966 N2-methylase RsmD
LEITRGNVVAALEWMAAEGHVFSLIFADPPYGEAAQELLRDQSLPRSLAAGGSLVLESAKREVLTVGKPWELMRESIYGDTRVSYLRMKQ